jgi:hypothetical protein
MLQIGIGPSCTRIGASLTHVPNGATRSAIYRFCSRPKSVMASQNTPCSS